MRSTGVVTTSNDDLVGDDQQTTVRVVLNAHRRLHHLVAEEEVEIEDAVTVVVGLDAEQTDATVAGVGDHQRGVWLTGGRQPTRVLELVCA